MEIITPHLKKYLKPICTSTTRPPGIRRPFLAWHLPALPAPSPDFPSSYFPISLVVLNHSLFSCYVATHVVPCVWNILHLLPPEKINWLFKIHSRRHFLSEAFFALPCLYLEHGGYCTVVTAIYLRIRPPHLSLMRTLRVGGQVLTLSVFLASVCDNAWHRRVAQDGLCN